jgi:hypothetical protein
MESLESLGDVIATRVVGRRYHRSFAAAAPAGAACALRREAGNAADAHALLVVPMLGGEDKDKVADKVGDGSASQEGPPVLPSLGHAPRDVAGVLSPLLDRGWLRLIGTLPQGALASSAAPTGDAPRLNLIGTSARPLPPAAAAALRAGWAAAAAAAAAADAAGGAAGAAVRNLRHVIDASLSPENTPLFPHSHASLLRALTSLPPPAAALLVRLYARKGLAWFRVPLLRYADVGDDVDAAVDALCAAGAARAVPQRADADAASDAGSEEEEDDVAARYGVLNAAELRAAAAAAAAAASASGGGSSRAAPADASRAASLRALLASRRSGSAAAAAAAEAAWAAAAVRACRLTSATRASLRRAFLLFFLSPSADLSTFALADIGTTRYPTVRMPPGAPPPAPLRVFASAAALSAYEEALATAAAADAATDARDDAALARHAADAVNALGFDPQALRRLAGGADLEADVIDADVPVRAPLVPFHLARFTAAHVRAGVASAGVGALERARRYADAVALLSRLLGCGRDTTAVVAGTSDADTDAPHSAVFRPGARGGWWVRLSTDLEHVGRLEDALAAAEAGLADGWTAPAEAEALRGKILRLAVPPRRWKAPPWAAAATAAPAPRVVCLRAPAALRAERGRKNLFAAPTSADAGAGAEDDALAADDDAPAAAARAAAAALARADASTSSAAASAPASASAPSSAHSAPASVTIEELALAHYASRGWCGMHAESGVWRTLFGLLFWDVLFDGATSPPGAFQHAFQNAPLDLGAPGFDSGARAAPLRARLAAIAAGRGPRLLAATWALRRGAAAAGVSWRRHTLAQLQDICACFGGAAVAAIMRLFASDYTAWRAGMPDLVLWRFTSPRANEGTNEGANEGGATANEGARANEGGPEGMLVEVKGPRDVLRPGQRAWAAALLAAGVAVEVLQFE